MSNKPIEPNEPEDESFYRPIGGGREPEDESMWPSGGGNMNGPKIGLEPDDGARYPSIPGMNGPKSGPGRWPTGSGSMNGPKVDKDPDDGTGRGPKV